MNYSKNIWVTGDVITAAKMNNIEGGIESMSSALNDQSRAVEKINTNSHWRVVTLTVNTGHFYEDGPRAYYRYDDDALEISLTGIYVTNAELKKNDVLFTISDLDVDIPYAYSMYMWSATAFKTLRIKLNTDGTVVLADDTSILPNYWHTIDCHLVLIRNAVS